jgi:hypothetical protein
MERVTSLARQIRMTGQRRIRGLVTTGLLCAALAGCASVAASTPAAVPAATSASGTPTAPQVGCASVSQATMVAVHESRRLVEPTGPTARTVTQRHATLVRALFRDFCAAITHPDNPPTPINCPADFGIDYAGTFYAGHQTLATFVYGASGCQQISLTAAGKTHATLVVGKAAAAAPHLEADLAAVLGVPESELSGSPAGQTQPGGPAAHAP